MAQPEVVAVDPLAVNARLRALGIPEDVLFRAVRNGESANNKSGFVEDWSERILLRPIDLDPMPLKAPVEPPVNSEPSVRRRA